MARGLIFKGFFFLRQERTRSDTVFSVFPDAIAKSFFLLVLPLECVTSNDFEPPLGHRPVNASGSQEVIGCRNHDLSISFAMTGPVYKDFMKSKVSLIIISQNRHF